MRWLPFIRQLLHVGSYVNDVMWVITFNLCGGSGDVLLRSPSKNEGLILPAAGNAAGRGQEASHLSANSAKRHKLLLKPSRGMKKQA